MRLRIISIFSLLVSGLMQIAIAGQSPAPLPATSGFPPMSRGSDYYFNQTHEITKPPPGCLQSKSPIEPWVATLRGMLVERTFYGPPWVTDAGTPRGVLLIKLDRPLSICGIRTLSQPPKIINEGGITGLSIPWWLGYTLEWRTGSMKLTRLVGEKEKIYDQDVNQEILNPYLDRNVQISGSVNMANFPMPWTINVVRVCLIVHGKVDRCRGKSKEITSLNAHHTR